MDNTRAVLKQAFIDAQQIGHIVNQYEFSKDFELKMQRLIRNQSGAFRLINTAGKKVACIILSVLIFATSMVFGVDAIRKPFIEALQSWFVNANEKLTNTKADNIADYFIENITQIKATNYLTVEPKEYIISEKQKVDEFIKLLSMTDWGEPENKYMGEVQYVFWNFEFKNQEKTVTTLSLCESFDGMGCVKISNSDKSKVYVISEQIYKDLIAFTNIKYYLHKSGIELPYESYSLAVQNKVLENLNDNEKEYVSMQLRELHMQIENMLLHYVSILKDPDSKYWSSAITGEPTKDPFSGEAYINGDWCFNYIIKRLSDIANVIKNEDIKADFFKMSKELERACNYHDIGGIFAIHEYIHDYDYFAANYPPYFKLLAPPDWDGVNVYFGHLEKYAGNN